MRGELSRFGRRYQRAGTRPITASDSANPQAANVGQKLRSKATPKIASTNAASRQRVAASDRRVARGQMLGIEGHKVGIRIRPTSYTFPMKTTISLVALALTPFALRADQPVQKPLDTSFLRTYSETRGFMLGRPVKPKPTPDGKTVLFLRRRAKTPEAEPVRVRRGHRQDARAADPRDAAQGGRGEADPRGEGPPRTACASRVGGFADFHLDEAGKSSSLQLSGKLYVFDRDDGEARELKTGTGTILDPKWSPDGK